MIILKKSIKTNHNKCDCCNRVFTDTLMRMYEIGEYKTFILCKDCEKQLKNVVTIVTNKKVICIDNKIHY